MYSTLYPQVQVVAYPQIASDECAVPRPMLDCPSGWPVKTRSSMLTQNKLSIARHFDRLGSQCKHSMLNSGVLG